MTELQEGGGTYVTFYTSKRYHQSLDYATPDEI